jgi:hypothetical protein
MFVARLLVCIVDAVSDKLFFNSEGHLIDFCFCLAVFHFADVMQQSLQPITQLTLVKSFISFRRSLK